MKYIIILFLGTISLGLSAQDSLSIVSKKKIKLTSPLDRMTNDMNFSSPSVIKQKSVFDAQKLPIFCKIEHKLAKSSKVNVMMRLGSLDYVDRLEGKKP